MKKFLLSMCCALGLLTANAETATYTCSALGSETLNTIVGQTISVGTAAELTFAKGSGSSNPAYNRAGDIRLYANNVMTVTPINGETITKIEFTIDNTQQATVAVSDGQFSQTQNGTTATWTGSATSALTFTVGAKADLTSDATKAGQFRFKSVTVTYGTGGEVTPPVDPDPDPDPTPGDETQTATFDFTKPATLDPAYPADKGSLVDNANTYENVNNVPFTNNGVTFVATKGTSTDARLYYQSGGNKQLRPYNGSTITISAPGLINKIEFSFNNTGSNLQEDGTDYKSTNNVWTGSAEEVVFNVTANSQINSVTVTYTGEAPAVAAPVVTCVDNMVSMTCSTPDAKIYYDLEGNTPTNNSMPYEGAFPITSTVTVKAIAYVGEQSSTVTTYVANYVGAYASFQDYIAGNPTAGGKVDGPITVVYQNGGNTYLKDSKGTYMLSYTTNSSSFKLPELNPGDVLEYIEGTYSPYSGLPEMVPTAIGTVTTGGAAPQPDEIALEEVSEEQLNAYVVINDVEIGPAKGTSGAQTRTYPINDGTNDDGRVVLYNTFYNSQYYDVVEIPEGTGFTVTGFTCINNGNLQITPISITGGEEVLTVANPVITPNGGVIAADATIEISCATEGAEIYYTLDGTVPSATEGNLYTAPFTLTESCTVSAIAILDGYNDSDVITADFVLLDASAVVATFNFTDPASLDLDVPTASAQEVNLDGKSATVNGVTVSFTDSSTSSTAIRLWYTATTGVDLRVYTGDSFTVVHTADNVFKSIEFTGLDKMPMTASVGTLTVAENGKSAVWTPESSASAVAVAEDEELISSVTFTATATARISTMDVVFDKDTVGVESVATDDENAPVEYYNLQGVRVANPTAGQLVIKKQGSNVTKVLVK